MTKSEVQIKKISTMDLGGKAAVIMESFSVNISGKPQDICDIHNNREIADSFCLKNVIYKIILDLLFQGNKTAW